MGISLQFREQKPPWYDRTTICIITMVLMMVLIWFGWVGIRMALAAEGMSYLLMPVLVTALALFVFANTSVRLWRRWQTYQKFKSE